MLRRWLVGAAIVGLAALSWGAWKTGLLCLWFLPDAGHLEARVVETTPDHLSLRLALLESKRSIVLDEISLDRTLRDALGVQAPEGFVEQSPLVPVEPSEAQARVAAAYNLQVHFDGALTVRADTPVVLRLPIRVQQPRRGRLTLSYRGPSFLARHCMSWTLVDVEIGAPSNQMQLTRPAQASEPRS